jgi:hypothetical protein
LAYAKNECDKFAGCKIAGPQHAARKVAIASTGILPNQAGEAMPNFAVKDISPARFEGEFAIEIEPTHSPTGSEADYLGKLSESLTGLADDERQDNSNPLQPRLADARRQYRTAEAAKLRLIAQEFADAKIDGNAAARATIEAAQTYGRNCPNLVAQDKAAAGFAGDFAITATNYQGTLKNSCFSRPVRI